jgi:hypothetical protein
LVIELHRSRFAAAARNYFTYSHSIRTAQNRARAEQRAGRPDRGRDEFRATQNRRRGHDWHHRRGRFGVGALAHLLKNRFYIGEVVYRGAVHRGEHEPILDAALFAAVQAKLAAQAVARRCRLRGPFALLTGRIFDAYGNRMSHRSGAARRPPLHRGFLLALSRIEVLDGVRHSPRSSEPRLKEKPRLARG